MEIYKLPDRERVYDAPPAIVALGNFDGVHLGHRALLDTVSRLANENGVSSAVWTFAAPAKTYGKVKILTENGEKLRLFSECGIEYAVIEDFSAVRDLSCEEFVREHLVSSLGIAGAVCGFNFRFGKNAAGDADTLSSLLSDMGKIFSVVSPVTVDGETVSSTAIRSFIENGDVEMAEKMLGREVAYTLPVNHGKALGRRLGYPTINQSLNCRMITPLCGVYFSCVTLPDGSIHNSLTNVGHRPTVEDGKDIRFETHIPDFSGDLYGESVKVTLLKMHREEERFENTDELSRKIGEDLKCARSYFAKKGR